MRIRALFWVATVGCLAVACGGNLITSTGEHDGAAGAPAAGGAGGISGMGAGGGSGSAGRSSQASTLAASKPIYGLLAPIFGVIVITLIAIAIALPVALSLAVVAREFQVPGLSPAVGAVVGG